jgi:hypothetical protein
VFTNKVLLDLENVKLTRNRRRDQIWETGKADYGFEGLEDSFVTQHHDITMHGDGDGDGEGGSMYRQAGFSAVQGVVGNNSSNQTLHGFHEAGSTVRTAVASSNGDNNNNNNNNNNSSSSEGDNNESYEDDGFDNFQYADDFNPDVVESVYAEEFDLSEDHGGGNGGLESGIAGLEAGSMALPPDSSIGISGSMEITMRPGTSANALRVGSASGGSRAATSSASVRFGSPAVPPPGMAVAMDMDRGPRPGTSAGGNYNPKYPHSGGNDKRQQQQQQQQPTSTPNGSSTNKVSTHRAQQLYDQMRGDDNNGNNSYNESCSGRPATTSGTSYATTATHTSLDSQGNVKPKRKGKKGKKGRNLPPARKKKAFNRSTFFELLLDTVEVPGPHAPRFGMLRTYSVILLFFLSFLVCDVSICLSYPSIVPCLHSMTRHDI